MFNVFAQTTSSLVEGLGDPLITDVAQISSNASDEIHGLDFGALIDDNYETFWHSDWHGKVSDPHYLQFEVNDPLSEGYLLSTYSVGMSVGIAIWSVQKSLAVKTVRHGIILLRLSSPTLIPVQKW